MMVSSPPRPPVVNLIRWSVCWMLHVCVCVWGGDDRSPFCSAGQLNSKTQLVSWWWVPPHVRPKPVTLCQYRVKHIQGALLGILGPVKRFFFPPGLLIQLFNEFLTIVILFYVSIIILLWAPKIPPPLILMPQNTSIGSVKNLRDDRAN